MGDYSGRLAVRIGLRRRALSVARLLILSGPRLEAGKSGRRLGIEQALGRDPKVNKPSSVNLTHLDHGAPNPLFAVFKMLADFLLLLAVIANHYTECSIYPVSP